MGTSTCHVMNGTELHEVPGMCGVVDGGIVDGLWGYEAGQSGVGDIFGWFTKIRRPARIPPGRRGPGLGIHEYLTELAASQAIGGHGLIALDWHSGNRSVLVDHELSGLVLGQTLATRPEDTYRALLEATAFGTRTIVDAFRDSGVPVKEFIVAGGLVKNGLLMQIYADVTGLQLSTIGSSQGPALGSAIHAAVAAGRYPDIRAAAAAMGSEPGAVFTPIPENVAAYEELFQEYRTLHDHFGRGANDVMHRLKAIQRRCRPPPRHRRGVRMSALLESIAQLRAEVCALHAELTRYELVVWTAGNVSARVPGHDLMVIKPSGVSYADLTPGHMVVTDLYGTPVSGANIGSGGTVDWGNPPLSPSSDTAAHAYVYRNMPDVGGVVHTHSTYATAWAARGEAIPCVLTMMGDEFGGPIPVGPFALIGDDSIGQGIVAALKNSNSPAVLMQNHGPFTIGKDARSAVKAAVMCEEVARTVHISRQLGEPMPIDPAQIDSLYDRYQNVYGR